MNEKLEALNEQLREALKQKQQAELAVYEAEADIYAVVHAINTLLAERPIVWTSGNAIFYPRGLKIPDRLVLYCAVQGIPADARLIIKSYHLDPSRDESQWYVLADESGREITASVGFVEYLIERQNHG